MDKLSILELINYVVKCIETVEIRARNLISVDDFTGESGELLLDGIAMKLQTIGESIKTLQKKDTELMNKIADNSYWSQMAKMRDIISHHYIRIDPNIIFEICQNYIFELKTNVLELKRTHLSSI